MLADRIESRVVFLGIFAVCAAMMAFGYCLQFAVGLEPCPLCITQRFFLSAVGICALVAGLHAPQATGLRIYAALSLMLCVTGGGFSSRHVWLQSLPPDQVPACGPGVAYMFESFPLTEALQILVRGDGNCAEVDWSFLGLSIPAWTLVSFTMLALVLIFILWRPVTRASGAK